MRPKPKQAFVHVHGGTAMMQEELSREVLFQQLSRLYSDMEEAYDTVAEKIGLSCDGCRDRGLSANPKRIWNKPKADQPRGKSLTSCVH